MSQQGSCKSASTPATLFPQAPWFRGSSSYVVTSRPRGLHPARALGRHPHDSVRALNYPGWRRSWRRARRGPSCKQRKRGTVMHCITAVGRQAHYLTQSHYKKQSTHAAAMWLNPSMHVPWQSLHTESQSTHMHICALWCSCGNVHKTTYADA